MKKKQKKVSAENFIRAWQTAENESEVIKWTGIKNPGCRATYYRKLGIPLRKLNPARPGRHKLEIERLKAIAESYNDNQ